MSQAERAVASTWHATGVSWTASAIAEAVRSGRLHPRRAVEESLSRIANRDSSIGAFQVVRGAAARTEADALATRPDLAGLPLAGVPIAVPDSISVVGEPRRLGSVATSSRPATHDHPAVARLRAAGAVVIGITRVPEFALYSTTDSSYGVTRNPWNPNRSAGGASGGSAAAVAAGMVPLAHGGDALGSVRIPAASCGLVGFKPGAGVTPLDPGDATWYGLLENGVLAGTAADTALAMAVLAAQPELAQLAPPPRRLVVAASLKSPLAAVRPDPACVRALNSVATILARSGHEVHLDEFHYSQRAIGSAVARWFATAADQMRAVDEPGEVGRRVRAQARVGRIVRRSPAMDPRLRDALAAEAERFLTAYDLLITPALAQPPVPARSWSSKSLARTLLKTVAWAPYAAPWNIVGYPAVVVPTGKLHPRTRTPLAVQLVARPGSESLLLSVAAGLEHVRPWPPVARGYA